MTREVKVSRRCLINITNTNPKYQLSIQEPEMTPFPLSAKYGGSTATVSGPRESVQWCRFSPFCSPPLIPLRDRRRRSPVRFHLSVNSRRWDPYRIPGEGGNAKASTFQYHLESQLGSSRCARWDCASLLGLAEDQVGPSLSWGFTFSSTA
jgi:hypothetical protein